MDVSPTCPQCHIPVRPTDYFCSNCGKNLQPKPLSINLMTQIGIYAGSVFLAPMGLIWGLRYLRERDPKAKLVGVVAMTLTILTLVIASKLVTDYIARVNEEVTRQLNGLQGF